MQGQAEEGIAQMREELTALRAAGCEAVRPYYLTLLADAQAKVERIEEGLGSLREAREAVNRMGGHFYETELYRLTAQQTLQLDVSRGLESDAEGYFLTACDVARRQNAKSLELRSLVSLSRMRQRQGKPEEAQQMLGEVYGSFTEEFETADLKAARALLAERG